jgi:hypothetical protein
VSVSPGTYDEDIDLAGKAITVAGAGTASIVRGTGNGPVVTITGGEGPETVLDALLITGGLADRGGGILIQSSSPTIVRNVIFANRARLQGSGVFIQASSAVLNNNLVAYNGSAGGDPHSIEIVDAAPRLINNTIARGDSNGIIIRGHSPAVVMNNVIAFNGRRINGDRRGRGICDFSANDDALIQYNLFFRNNVAALLTDGRDFRRIRNAERQIGPPRLVGNVDGPPHFASGVPPREPESATINVADFALSASPTGRAPHAGNPDPTFTNLDGSRNDIGFTGGPDAPALP